MNHANLLLKLNDIFFVLHAHYKLPHIIYYTIA